MHALSLGTVGVRAESVNLISYHGRDGRYHLSRSAHITARSCPRLCPLHPKVELPVCRSPGMAASTTISPHCNKYSCFFYFFSCWLLFCCSTILWSFPNHLVHLINNIVFWEQRFPAFNSHNCSHLCFYNRCCLLGHFFIIFKRKANLNLVFNKASWRI